MMAMLVSPTEPAHLRDLGTSSSLPERYGADFLWFAHGRKWGVQRKEFPGDFTASLRDGRLGKELVQGKSLDGGMVLLLEGEATWTNEGAVIGRGRLTIGEVWGLMWSAAFHYEAYLVQVKYPEWTPHLLKNLMTWTRKKEHGSLERRPGPASLWGQPSSRDWALHMIQGLPGVGRGLAEAIYDHFGGVPLQWTVDGPKALMEVPGIGKVRAEKMWKALN